MKPKEKTKRFDIPGEEFPVLATVMLAEIVSAIPKRERKAFAPVIFKGILAGYDRWATGTLNKAPNLFKLLEDVDIAAFVREMGGEEAAEAFTKILAMFG